MYSFTPILRNTQNVCVDFYFILLGSIYAKCTFKYIRKVSLRHNWTTQRSMYISHMFRTHCTNQVYLCACQIQTYMYVQFSFELHRNLCFCISVWLMYCYVFHLQQARHVFNVLSLIQNDTLLLNLTLNLFRK